MLQNLRTQCSITPESATGEDLVTAGWSVVAVVPTGVHVNGAQNNDPRTGQVTRFSDKDSLVYITPGSVPRGSYTALLEWDDVESGPMQVRGAKLAAEFPIVTVVNQTSQDALSVPKPEVTVLQELTSGGDYAFLGLPPDHLIGFDWAWNSKTGRVNEGSTALPLEIEARSASADEQSHNAQYGSGIAFGVAAAALIAALQEFMNSATSRNQDLSATSTNV